MNDAVGEKGEHLFMCSTKAVQLHLVLNKSHPVKKLIVIDNQTLPY